jgi:hypothetical protein
LNRRWKCERIFWKSANSCLSLKSWNSNNWLKCSRSRQWSNS